MGVESTAYDKKLYDKLNDVNSLIGAYPQLKKSTNSSVKFSAAEGLLPWREITAFGFYFQPFQRYHPAFFFGYAN